MRRQIRPTEMLNIRERLADGRWLAASCLRKLEGSALPIRVHRIPTINLASSLATLAAATDVIVPSIAGEASATIAGVPLAIVQAAEHDRHRSAIYSLGICKLNKIATTKYGTRFELLDRETQSEVLKALEGNEPESRSDPISRSLDLLNQVLHPERLFVRVLVADVLDAFYTSEHAWAWLSYDGPPMPLGYLDVDRPRDPQLPMEVLVS